MKYYSTNNKGKFFSFEQAVMKGLADDSGLFMPCEIPSLDNSFISSISKMPFTEIAYNVVKEFTGSEIPASRLEEIIHEAINFRAPICDIEKNIYILELFHGPTLAFKDFGARFMAKTMGWFAQKRNEVLNILVATSGDTGSAVANGFYNVPGINVFILYPKGRVSRIQEQQLTTLDKNITALEIEGTFDDCQRMVKKAFLDPQLLNRLKLSSANSINIARLLPQSFYYFEAYKQIKDKSLPVVFSVPSGNLGNLTAGLIAKKMGLPVSKFVSATNRNDVFTEFISTGNFNPRASVQTISNAMDVGNPSNLYRITDLYPESIENIRKDIYSETYSDEETRKAIKEVFQNTGYIIDPHGAVGYLALKGYAKKHNLEEFTGIILETAHASKFKDIVEDTIHTTIPIPDRLAACMQKEKKSILLSSDYNDFKNFLVSIS